MEKCKNPYCSNAPTCRGLCGNCYYSARRLVVTNKTTWKELEEQGKVLPSRKPGYNSPTIEWLLRK